MCNDRYLDLLPCYARSVCMPRAVRAIVARDRPRVGSLSELSRSREWGAKEQLVFLRAMNRPSKRAARVSFLGGSSYRSRRQLFSDIFRRNRRRQHTHSHTHITPWHVFLSIMHPSLTPSSCLPGDLSCPLRGSSSWTDLGGSPTARWCQQYKGLLAFI